MRTCPLKGICAHMVQESLRRCPRPRHPQPENCCFGRRSIKLGTGNCGLQARPSQSPRRSALVTAEVLTLCCVLGPMLGVEMFNSPHVSKAGTRVSFLQMKRSPTIQLPHGPGGDVYSCRDSVRGYMCHVGQKGSFPAHLDICYPGGLAPGAGERLQKTRCPSAPCCHACTAPAIGRRAPRVDTLSSR